MGYQRPPLKLVFEDPQYEGLEIRMRRLALGDMFEVAELADLGDDIAGQKEQLDRLLTVMAAAIVSWNLEDEGGNPVEPVKGEPAGTMLDGTRQASTGLYALDVSLVMDVVGAWLQAVGGVSRPLVESSTSGLPSPEEFDLTAALSESL